VTKDEDFAIYDLPLEADVDAFDNGGEMEAGPDRSNLKFDFDRDLTSRWNQRVTRSLIDELKIRCRERGLPDVSEVYLEHLVVEKFKRGQGSWNGSKQKLIDGEVETWEEVETRMRDTMVRRTQAARRRERRVKVGVVYPISSEMRRLIVVDLRNTQGDSTHCGLSFARRRSLVLMTFNSGNGFGKSLNDLESME
jgi:hypothetical protein